MFICHATRNIKMTINNNNNNNNNNKNKQLMKKKIDVTIMVAEEEILESTRLIGA